MSNNLLSRPSRDATWPNPLYELTLAVASAREPADVFEAALTCLQTSLAVDRSAILLFDDQGVMRFRASRGLSDAYRAAVDGHSPWSQDTTDASPVLVGDVRLEPSLAGLLATIEGEGIRALAFIPLRLGTKLLGTLMLYYDRTHAFSEREVITAQTVAAHVGFAIDQQKHRDTERRFRGLIESLGVAVYVTDGEGRITFYNDEAAMLWGREPEIGMERWCGSWRLFWPDGTAMRHEDCPMAITLQEGTPVRGREAIAERPDGTRVNFVPYPTPILDSGGRVTGAVNVLVDITARKRAEEALREANNALVRIAGDLRIANAAKDEFLSLVSHELKTPLTTIRGNADVLHRRDGDIDPESRRVALADIVTEGDRLNRIIENLLLLARAEGGQGLQAEPILAIRVVKRVVDRHRSQYPWRTFEIVERGDPRPVIFSEACLEQVTENLISNAEKYSPSTEPIVIHFDRLEHELQMRVLDCGQGIEAKEAEHLFDPFYRSNDARGRATGLGIGLAVCKRLVETQGGRVWARGRPEGGSEFGFAIPISGEDGCESGVRTN